MTIVFRVRVPVLSEHSSVMPAISSMAVRRVTMAPCCASWREPSASVVVLHARKSFHQGSAAFSVANVRIPQ